MSWDFAFAIRRGVYGLCPRTSLDFPRGEWLIGCSAHFALITTNKNIRSQVWQEKERTPNCLKGTCNVICMYLSRPGPVQMFHPIARTKPTGRRLPSPQPRPTPSLSAPEAATPYDGRSLSPLELDFAPSLSGCLLSPFLSLRESGEYCAQNH